MCAYVFPPRVRATRFRVIATETTLDVETTENDSSFSDHWESTCEVRSGVSALNAGISTADLRCRTSASDGDQPFFDFQVEKPAISAPGSAQPRYPDILKSAGVEGETVVQFVVDKSGRAELGTFKVLRATHELFAATVRNTLPEMRFHPAEVGGCKVKQLVSQTFAFAIQR